MTQLYLVGTTFLDTQCSSRLETLLEKLRPTTIFVEGTEHTFQRQKKLRPAVIKSFVQSMKSKGYDREFIDATRDIGLSIGCEQNVCNTYAADHDVKLIYLGNTKANKKVDNNEAERFKRIAREYIDLLPSAKDLEQLGITKPSGRELQAEVRKWCANFYDGLRTMMTSTSPYYTKVMAAALKFKIACEPEQHPLDQWRPLNDGRDAHFAATIRTNMPQEGSACAIMDASRLIHVPGGPMTVYARLQRKYAPVRGPLHGFPV